MMKTDKIFKILSLSFLIVSSIPLNAAEEFTKEIKETFTISQGGQVNIINKYGDIDIRPVDGNEVTFRVEIVVEAKNSDRANEIFEAIDIKFTNEDNNVKAETSIERLSRFWNKMKNWGKSSYEINYSVNAPRHVYLELKNEYGNINTGDMDNGMGLNLKYGNFTIGSVHDLNVNLGYGNGEADRVENADIKIQYGKVIFERAQNMEIKSQYATIEVNEAKEVRTTSQYDTYKLGDMTVFRNKGQYDKIRIENVNDIRINTQYTNLELEDVKNNAEFDTQYGSIVINDLSTGFDEIHFNSKYTGIRIDSDPGVSFDYDVKTEHADLKVPHYTQYTEEGSKKSVRAVKNGGGGIIKITARYGHVKIK